MDTTDRRMGGLSDQVLHVMPSFPECLAQGEDMLLDTIEDVQGVIEHEPYSH